MEEKNKYQLKRNDLVYPELSYKVYGVLFDVFRKVGPGFLEKHYQKAIGIALREVGLKVEEQLMVPLLFEDKVIGKYFLDFLIENTVVLEIKKGDYYNKQNIDQVVAYLKAKKIKLGLIANFTSHGVKIKRIINLK
jgi:GxxExxY protein